MPPPAGVDTILTGKEVVLLRKRSAFPHKNAYEIERDYQK